MSSRRPRSYCTVVRVDRYNRSVYIYLYTSVTERRGPAAAAADVCPNDGRRGPMPNTISILDARRENAPKVGQVDIIRVYCPIFPYRRDPGGAPRPTHTQFSRREGNSYYCT